MNKKKIGPNILIPMPMGIIGTHVGGKANFMAVGWISRANANPPMIAAGIGRHHATCDGIMQCGEFSVNIPGKDLLVKTDYAGIVSGKKVDKSGIFEIFYGDLKSAPMAAGAILSLECRVVQSVELPTNTLFIGEITGAWSEERHLEGDAVNFAGSGAYFLTMPDNRYWAFGESIGKAWSDGKVLMK